MTVQILTPLQKQLIKTFYESGRSTTALAKDYYVSPRTIHRVLAEFGVPTRKPGRPRTKNKNKDQHQEKTVIDKCVSSVAVPDITAVPVIVPELTPTPTTPDSFLTKVKKFFSSLFA